MTVRPSSLLVSYRLLVILRCAHCNFGSRKSVVMCSTFPFAPNKEDSRVKLPSADKSASSFLVSTHLIWILGPKFILSSNQSDATLWVRGTCLIVVLRPLMTILITAFVVFKYVRLRFTFRRIYVCGHVIEACQLINILVTFCPQFDVCCACCSFPQLLDSAFACRILLGCIR